MTTLQDMRQLKTNKGLSGRKICVGNYGDHSFRENLRMVRFFFPYSAGKAEILNHPFTYKLSFFFQNCTSMKQNFFSCFYSSIFREYDSARGNLRHELQMLFSLLLV